MAAVQITTLRFLVSKAIWKIVQETQKKNFQVICKWTSILFFTAYLLSTMTWRQLETLAVTVEMEVLMYSS